eukprot:CAMPEP_0185584918 /NCGR_PEP_ID=MMETSP0434-20130131/35380_1 /TAXON_ID=626734 ORGANISM="Favella taraikaensis, Strain Fe Narragansett Bay" /NCGR_SAMPLE_ID=MMETSP0434 /ASSEMBLY_ACC=CAM_ASM_000379 /LENGTH=62 /DNA_ID=CAMNT_0028204967 /DNA_START=153 /DNA_END=338 /DNA_ORIENTATION=-
MSFLNSLNLDGEPTVAGVFTIAAAHVFSSFPVATLFWVLKKAVNSPSTLAMLREAVGPGVDA